MDYKREPNGQRLDFHGINTVLPPDLLPPGKHPFAENVRRYIQGGVASRAKQDSSVATMGGVPVHSLRRLNDLTPAGPGSGFIIVGGAGSTLYSGSIAIDSGYSGNPLSLIPFRPDASVQPWMYVADSNKMAKVRSDNTTYKWGIAEPQWAPSVTFSGGGGGPSQIFYRYVYRSSATGAISNPSPESTPGSNTQSTFTGTTTADDYASKITFNSAQWEFNSHQLRTTGAATASAGLLDYVVWHSFGLSVPSGVNIDGISVAFRWLNQPSYPAGTLANAALYYNGNVIGTVKSPGVVSTSTASDTTVGGSADTWGADLTADILNDASFGIGVQIFQNTGRIFQEQMVVTVYVSEQSASITPTPSGDPQVDKIDFYRQGGGLESFTYVGTGPNTATAFSDLQNDAVVANNPLLQFDNYEPFPSIDLPKSGTVNVAASVIAGVMDVAWASGNTFNIRWLPGTIVVIGGVAYTMYQRPFNTTSLRVILPGDMPLVTTGLTYEIQEPILAAQPMPYVWGPTDNVNFMFGCGDPLRPGVLYWTKGNNPDSAPDTNQQDVTSPSEPLQNGCIVSGIGMVFSSERAWMIWPNFFNAYATVTGTVGSTWTLQESISTRGLYITKAIGVDGGGNVFFRAKDGIYISPSGQGAKSITDDDLFNLFPHEGIQPQPVTIAGFTIYPPDDTQPHLQKINVANGYVYYDYVDTTNTPRTLVFDIAALGWVTDSYQHPVTLHVLEEGPNANSTLTGCQDGTVRELTLTGAEVSNCTLLMPSFNAGDTRAQKHFGDLFIEGDTLDQI